MKKIVTAVALSTLLFAGAASANGTNASVAGLLIKKNANVAAQPARASGAGLVMGGGAASKSKVKVKVKIKVKIKDKR